VLVEIHKRWLKKKEVPTDSSTLIRSLLGLGYCIQGFRCFPWMIVNFFLKDSLQVDPSTLQMLQNTANLPMVGKSLYGIVSDAVYINGEHRIPYIAFGGNLGASITEVANDAIVAEIGKRKTASKNAESSSSGELQSFVWMASSVGGVLGNLLAGIAIARASPQVLFLVFGLFVGVQFCITIIVREKNLHLSKNPSSGSIKRQMSELIVALRKPEIAKAIAWFTASYAVIPALTGIMFFYQTQVLNIDSSVLGISKVFAQAAMLLWSAIYNKRLKSASPRKLMTTIQVTIAVFIVSDVLFVNNFYRKLGVPDSLYVVVFSGLLETLYFSKILPFSVLMAQLCPPGCEGSLMAFVMSAIALAFIMSGYLGVALTSFLGITSDDFSGLPKCILIATASTLVPLFWSSCIPDNVKPKARRKEENSKIGVLHPKATSNGERDA
ncbi:hypothetical protein V2J09_000631, partial [Rumex salicifolius]